MPTCDVAVIGAGPYGLSAAAHLKSCKSLDVQVFGEPMAFWQRHMPKGMLLRSPIAGSHLSDPLRALTLQAHKAISGSNIAAPLPLDHFIEYGRWFQNQTSPELVGTKVDRVQKEGYGFSVHLEDGSSWRARRVVVAAGILPFTWRPQEFNALPRSLASHSSEHTDLSGFSGQKVVVVGGGQSALESAALLHEAEADVEVLVRAPSARWLWRRSWLHTNPLISRALYAPPDVGPAGISHLVARPSLIRLLPRDLADAIARRSIRPAGAAWLRPRCGSFPITTSRVVVAAARSVGKVILKLNDGSQRRVDHVLLATGFHVNIARYPFLSQELLAGVHRFEGYPVLDRGFECSVPGLHFLGAPAAWSFGPLMRFVAGAEFACRALTRRVAHSSSVGDTAQREIVDGPLSAPALHKISPHGNS